MIDDYLAQYCAETTNEALSIEPASSEGDNVAFVRDDADEFRDNCAEQKRAQLGSFVWSPNQANSKALLIHMNPIILLYRPNGQNLRIWVASTSPGAAGQPESE
jgi:hypothetical protein